MRLITADDKLEKFVTDLENNLNDFFQDGVVFAFLEVPGLLTLGLALVNQPHVLSVNVLVGVIQYLNILHAF